MRFCIGLALILLLLSSCFVSSSLIFTESDIGESANLLMNPGFAPYALEGGEPCEAGLCMWNPTAMVLIRL